MKPNVLVAALGLFFAAAVVITVCGACVWFFVEAAHAAKGARGGLFGMGLLLTPPSAVGLYALAWAWRRRVIWR